MRSQISIFLFLALLLTVPVQSRSENHTQTNISFDFCGNTISLTLDPTMIRPLGEARDLQSITEFCQGLLSSRHGDFSKEFIAYREKLGMADWLFYQFIRRTAQQISPKANDYYRYTLYKWFLLHLSGYEPALRLSSAKLLFYVQSDENIYNIPFYVKEGKQFVCLNYHDYGNHVEFDKESFEEVMVAKAPGCRSFSYRISRLPDFKTSQYQEKDIAFNYNEQTYHFRIRLNSEIRTFFTNYPSVDYGDLLNIPLSRETYETLIPVLKKTLQGMKHRDGVDYLMRFTRYAFLFETDLHAFGTEKRLTPEQTLLYDKSDCEDRVALFYFLVKEIYNIPMIILSYPGHITIAVKFDRPIGRPVMYNGEAYTLCEPTPQRVDLPLGHLMPEYLKMNYEVVYSYSPAQK
jgi:hypothetical protein